MKKEIFNESIYNGVNELTKEHKFDKAWAEKEDLSQIFTIIPPEKDAFDDGRVTYKYNSDGFRCDEFKKNHEGKLHILFAGCSETEGVGSPLDTSWAKMLYDRIDYVNDTSGYFNLGKAGWGYQRIMNSITTYVDEYGKPDYIFLLHPNVARPIEWSIDQNRYNQVQYPHNFNEINVNHNIKLDETKQKNLFIEFVYAMSLFEKYCKAMGIKLIWTTWETEIESKNIKFFQHQFPSYFHLHSDEDLTEFIKRDRPNMIFRTDDLTRRDNHSGILKCKWWGNQFAAQAQRKGLKIHDRFFID